MVNQKLFSMSNIKKQVAKTLAWKKNTTYCATRLGILESEYIKLKKEILKEKYKAKKKLKVINDQSSKFTESVDLDKGEKTISITSTSEPKLADEIIKLLKIDTTQWRLSQYWNKQMGDHWRVSALVSKVKETPADLLKHLKYQKQLFLIKKT